ncbi:heparinase II/III family protein [Sulfurifustis variabilis]|nr:alginate lyase family protein [Sulfurifustis variabilis]
MERLLRKSEFAAPESRASPLQWYWNRLRCMSVPEIGYRLRQKVAGQAQQIGLGTARGVPRPDLARRGRLWIAPNPDVDPAPYRAAAERVLSGRLRVFGMDIDQGPVPEWNRDPKSGRLAPLGFGKHLNYRDAALVGDIKYLWEPNRHLHLVTLAQAYRLSGDLRYALGVRRLLDSWFAQCPYLHGPNWTSSLELGIRLINWSLVWQLLGGADASVFADSEGRRFRHAWLSSVFRHLHFIAGHFSRFSSANNHLIGEAAGLYIGATTWPHWHRTGVWREQARKILLREALRQNAPDGVNREQAIAYQQFVLDFLLLSGRAARAHGEPFPDAYWRRLESMLGFIAALLDTGGHMPMIGDADDGFVVALAPDSGFCPYRSLLATGAVLFGRPDFKCKSRAFDDKSRWLLGRDGEDAYARLPSVAGTATRAFPEGGYWVLGKDLDAATEIRLVVDAGPLGYERIAAHGHADALAFTLSIGGNEFLIDPGTYAYHTEREWRDYFRGTGAHNTVRVDGADQSVPGGPFMWMRHARAACREWRPGEYMDVFVGRHDGYSRLEDPVGHERRIVLDKAEERIEVTDTLTCARGHTVERCWHFAEGVAVRGGRDGEIEASCGEIRVRFVPGEAVELALYRGSETPRFGWVSRRFDVKIPTTTAVWRSAIAGATRLTARLLIERQGVRP